MLCLLTLCLALGAAADRDGVAAQVAESATELKVMAKGHVSAHGQHHKSRHQGRPKEEDHSGERNDKVQRIMDAMEGHGSLPRKHLDHYSPELAAQIEGRHPHHDQEQHEDAAPGQQDRQPAPPRRLQRQSHEQPEEADSQPRFEKLSLAHPSNDFAAPDVSHSSETPRHLAHARQLPPLKSLAELPAKEGGELTQERSAEKRYSAEDRDDSFEREGGGEDAIEDYKRREEDARRDAKQTKISRQHEVEEDTQKEKMSRRHEVQEDAKQEKISRRHGVEEDAGEFEAYERQQKPTLQTEAIHPSDEEVAEHSEHSGHPRFGNIDLNGDGFIDGIEFQNAVANGKLKS